MRNWKFGGTPEALADWKTELEVRGIECPEVKAAKKVNKFNGYVSYAYSLTVAVPEEKVADLNTLLRSGWNLKITVTPAK